MRIEDVTAERLLGLPDYKLRNLHFRFVEVYRSKFDGKDVQKADYYSHGELISTLERGDLLDKYRALKKVMKSRGMKMVGDDAIDRVLFKRSMQGLDVPAIGDVLLQESFMSVVGQFIRGPKTAQEIEVLVKDAGGVRDMALEERVEEVLKAATGKPAAFVYADDSAHEDHIPIFDLVLRARPETRRIEAQVKKANDKKDEILKPFPNEHSARLQSPDKFDAHRRTKGGKIFNRVTIPAAVSIIWGHPKDADKDTWIPESIRFPKKGWTAIKAKKWLKDNEVKYKLFEAATTGSVSKFKVDKVFVDRPEIAVILSEPEYYENLERVHGGKLYNLIPLPGGAILVLADYAGIAGHSYEFQKEPIAIRFPAADWTEKKVEAWLKENKISYIRIERSKERILKFDFLKVDEELQVVGGIVYEPDTIDTQGDYTDSKEIQKAMYLFMEKYAKDSRKIKVMHAGRSYNFPVLESFQPEQDIRKGGKKVKAGAWWMMLKVPDREIWKKVKSGELTGFSIGGSASA